MEVHTFNPNSWEAGAGGAEFEARLVYVVSVRTAKAAKRNPVSKNQRGVSEWYFTVTSVGFLIMSIHIFAICKREAGETA